MRTPPHSSSVPRFLEPRKLAVQGRTVAGEIQPGECANLAGAVAAIDGPLQANLSFYKDEQNRVRLDGRVHAHVTRTCQRCLEQVGLQLDSEFALAVVFSEEEVRNLPRELDAWHLQQEAGDIVALLEEELIVSLPIASTHPEGECSFPVKLASTGSGEGYSQQDNPFNVLQQLKN